MSQLTYLNPSKKKSGGSKKTRNKKSSSTANKSSLLTVINGHVKSKLPKVIETKIRYRRNPVPAIANDIAGGVVSGAGAVISNIVAHKLNVNFGKNKELKPLLATAVGVGLSFALDMHKATKRFSKPFLSGTVAVAAHEMLSSVVKKNYPDLLGEYDESMLGSFEYDRMLSKDDQMSLGNESDSLLGIYDNTLSDNFVDENDLL